MRRALPLVFLLVACAKQETLAPAARQPKAPSRPGSAQQVRTIAFPVQGVVPYVAAGGWVSYVDEKANAFRLLSYRDGRWSEPKTIASDANLLVNRADFPSIAVDGSDLVATWSTRREHGTVVHVARSRDGGAAWSAPVTPHPDQVSQFGFVSLAGGEGVYLDGRKLAGGIEGEGEMELRALDGTALDPRVCDCCQTAMAVTSEGPIVAYRDRSAEEVRDISVVRRTAAGWSAPKSVHADGWKIPGCPVNGPQIDADGKRVAVAWFTSANGDPRVYVAFSDDAGATFAAPVRVDAGQSAGRVDAVLLPDGAAIVTWVAQSGGKASLHARRVSREGTLGDPIDLGESAGFPRAALWDQNVAVVWSTPGGVQVRLIERL